MTLRRSLAIASAILAWAGPATADTQNPRDRLIDLATIEVYHELCRFDLSDAQENAIAAARDSLIDLGRVSSFDITSIHDEIATAMAREVEEGLCKPGGPGARDYREKLEDLDRP